MIKTFHLKMAMKNIILNGVYSLRVIVTMLNIHVKESEVLHLDDKYKQALEDVLINLRSIESPNLGDSYINESIEIITNVLKEEIK
ncbi:hypothetical protein [Clostridium tagluense]|uniref:hypothetical protein n=1 Tax=Clostridium tagluense TaxID=360422 RepID=UPI001CF58CFD|nr:hypothetical protein [Clostridium tagluense]MCB2300441.1 hypothetical protein [Clostridium tagluense]